jgi:hypothetical protein
MASLIDFLTQAEGFEIELRRVILELGLLLLMLYELAVFFRFLWRRWREEKHQ